MTPPPTTRGVAPEAGTEQADVHGAGSRLTLWRSLGVDVRLQLVTVLATGITTFMFVPLLVMHLASQDLPAGTIGLVAGMLAFSSQAFSLVIGWSVDRLGLRKTLSAAFGLRIAGYLLLGVALANASPTGVLVIAVVCIGVGGSMLGLSVKTSLVLASRGRPREMLALRSTFVNVGVVSGPAIGGLVYPLGFTYILAACVVSHAVLAIAVLPRTRAAVPEAAVAAPAAPQTGVADPEDTGATSPASPRKDRRHWAALLLLGLAFWTIYSQLTVIVPLAALGKTDSTRAVLIIYTVNGMMCVLLQYALLKSVLHRTSTRTLLALGFLFFAVADTALAFAGGWWAVGLFVVPFTLAEMCLGPGLDQQAVSMVRARATGAALGAMGAAGAIGTLAGSWGGGHVLEHVTPVHALTALATLSLLVGLASLSLPSAPTVERTP